MQKNKITLSPETPPTVTEQPGEKDGGSQTLTSNTLSPLVKAVNVAWQQDINEQPGTEESRYRQPEEGKPSSDFFLMPPGFNLSPYYSSTLPLIPIWLPGEVDYLHGWTLLEKGHYCQALPYLEKAAGAGYPPSYLWLSWLYSEGGRIGPKNLEKSQHYAMQAAQQFAWFLQAAQSGKAHDQCNLGLCYDSGLGVKQNCAQGNEWYYKAAVQGDATAQHNLATSYAKGLGVNRDHVKAFEWFRKAAEQNLARAQSALGVCYNDGLGVQQDHAQAFEWFRRAAEQDHAHAQSNLGMCYTNGLGVKPDDCQAFEWYRKAAEQGHPVAQYNLGACYYNGRGVTQNDAQGVEWYRKAAEQNLAIAQFNLGACYYHGYGIVQNDDQAALWFYKAAKQNLAIAQFNLGICYYHGRGIEQNPAQAILWFHKAAMQGDANAQQQLKNLRRQYPHQDTLTAPNSNTFFFTPKASQPKPQPSASGNADFFNHLLNRQ